MVAFVENTQDRLVGWIDRFEGSAAFAGRELAINEVVVAIGNRHRRSLWSRGIQPLGPEWTRFRAMGRCRSRVVHAGIDGTRYGTLLATNPLGEQHEGPFG